MANIGDLRLKRIQSFDRLFRRIDKTVQTNQAKLAVDEFKNLRTTMFDSCGHPFQHATGDILPVTIKKS